MGSSQSQNIMGNSVSQDDAEIHTPLNRNLSKSSPVTDINHVLLKELHLEFIKLYVNSRNALHCATETPNEKFHHNLTQNLQLNECCNRIEAYSKGVADLVTERLQAATEHEYTIPNTDSESVGSYINSRNSVDCGAPRAPAPSHGQGSGKHASESLNTGADVM